MGGGIILKNEDLKKLVISARQGNQKSYLEILNHFEKFIYNFSKCIWIKNFDIGDIRQECYLSITMCVYRCDLDKFDFNSYTISAIKNNIFSKIRLLARQRYEGSLDKPFSSDSEITPLDLLVNKNDTIENSTLYIALDSLDPDERELIIYIYIVGYSAAEYARMKGINYRTCIRKKDMILNKLKYKLK